MKSYKQIVTLTIFILSFSLSFGQSFEKETIGITWYDLQSYGSLQNRFYIHEDGTKAAVWTMGFDYQNYFQTDRGTGYNYFNGTSWLDPPIERIEEERTGWPCYAPLGLNGEVIVSHIASSALPDEGLLISIREEKGEGDWEFLNLLGPPDYEDILWPRMITNGSSNQNIHILASTRPAGMPYQGQFPALLYYRSTDSGQSWEIEHHVFPELNLFSYNQIPEDRYNWASPKGDTIAFIIGAKTIDLILMKSYDNGNTWEKTIVWEHPIPFYTTGNITEDSIYCCDGSSSIALDNQGNAHIVFGIDILYYSGGWFIPVPPDGLAYWNESMLPFKATINALHPDTLMESGQLVGWSQEINNNGQLEFISDPVRYRQGGMSNMPSLVSQYDNLYLVYSSVTELYDNGIENFRHIWFRSSTDNGDSWGEFYDINGGLVGGFEENIFPCLAVNEDHLGLIFQQDFEPGLASLGQYHPYIENQIKYVNLDDYLFPPVGLEIKPSTPEFVISPIPAKECINIKGELQSGDLIEIVEMSGKVIVHHYVKQKTNWLKLNLGRIPTGINILRITSKEIYFTERIVISD